MHSINSSPLLCGCYVIQCIIFQIKPFNLCPVGIKYRYITICLELRRNIYIFMCILNRSALGQLNWLTTAIVSPRTSQRGEAPTSPKRRNQTGGNALWQSVFTVATELALRHVSWT